MRECIDSHNTEHIHLPLPPCIDQNLEHQKFAMAVYARFMRHMRYSERRRESVKVLESIRFVADLMDHSDAHIAKVLTTLGMRAPRAAYPQAFLDFVDNAMRCSAWQLGAADSKLKDLYSYWRGDEATQCRVPTRDDTAGRGKTITDGHITSYGESLRNHRPYQHYGDDRIHPY